MFELIFLFVAIVFGYWAIDCNEKSKYGGKTKPFGEFFWGVFR